MSVKNEYEKRSIIKVESVCVKSTRFCDVCGKEITQDYYEVEIGCRTSYYSFTDYDSECFDTCSVECSKEKVNEFFNQSEANIDVDVEYELNIKKEQFQQINLTEV